MTATRRSTRALGAFALALGLVVAPALVAAPSAQAATNGQWSVKPAASSGGGNARQFIFLEVRPGQTVKDAVVVSNETKKTKIFDLFSADAFNGGVNGAFSLTTVVDKPKDLGAWTSVSKDK